MLPGVACVYNLMVLVLVGHRPFLAPAFAEGLGKTAPNFGKLSSSKSPPLPV
jgi:hypothetical protein